MRFSMLAVAVLALSLSACAKHASHATASAGCCAGKTEGAMCKHDGHESHEAHAVSATPVAAEMKDGKGCEMHGDKAMACAHEAGSHEAGAKGEMCEHKDGKDCCAKMAAAATPAATPAPAK